VARTVGTPNPSYADKRAQLLDRVRQRLLAADGASASMRELAQAAGVSVATLAHYFGRREGVIAALLQAALDDGQEHLDWTVITDLPFAALIEAFAGYCAAGFRFGLADFHMLGLREGLGQGSLGPGYLDTLLDPTVNSLAERLRIHQEREEMIACDPRFAALALLSPILLAFLHQDKLGGCTASPMNIDAFLAAHVAGFVRGYSAA
jgi:AcrR family transcriptional regulator